MTTHPYDYAGADRHDDDEPRYIVGRGRHGSEEDDHPALAPVIPLFGRHADRSWSGCSSRPEDRYGSWARFDDGAYDERRDEDGGLMLRYTEPDGLGASLTQPPTAETVRRGGAGTGTVRPAPTGYSNDYRVDRRREPECTMGAMNTRPPGADLPVGKLVSDVARDLSTLVRQEIALAKAETKVEMSKAGKAGGALGVAALAGPLFILFASLAAMFGLGALLPLGWAALIVAAVWGIIGGGAGAFGVRRLKTIRPVPAQTIQTVKEDVRWIRNRNG